MHKFLCFFTILFLGYFLLKPFNSSSSKSLITISDYKLESENQKVSNYPPELPKTITFAGEDVPLDKLDVRESLDRELLVNMYWHSQTFLLLKRANRFFPIIEPVLKENNIHNDFKYLALIESGFANVVSPAGAAGFWQFIKSTGSKYGLIIDEEVDERYNIEKATEAACQYLKNSFNIFKSWTMAAAAYNMGDGGLGNQVKNQKVFNYYDLYLNTETARYVFRILAVKVIFENPQKYGFKFKDSDLYPFVKTNTLSVDTAITDLAQFALDNGINLKILKEYNPWLRKTTLINKAKNLYQIKIPVLEELYYESHFPALNKNEND